MSKQKRILTQAIDVQTRKQEMLSMEKKRDLEQLQLRKGEILAKYNERVVELREKGLQIRDLIERAKIEADDNLQDILGMWQEANEFILNKYPEGSTMSYDQLEDIANQTQRDQGEIFSPEGANKGKILAASSPKSVKKGGQKGSAEKA